MFIGRLATPLLESVAVVMLSCFNVSVPAICQLINILRCCPIYQIKLVASNMYYYLPGMNDSTYYFDII